MSKLFEGGNLGEIEVQNRVFMAPLTRNRAHADGTPHEMAVNYYAQRASAGLIIAEATQIAPEGKGYLDTPGIFNADHVQAWRKVTESVHANGGKIVLQLWHVGRISHSSLLPDGVAPLAPSAITANAEVRTHEGMVATSEPRALSTETVTSIVDEYARATRLAIEAGFDGVEVHGANGYLLNQFISVNTNLRDDQYGGSVENRARLLLQVVDAVSREAGSGRVGVRLSPTGTFNDMVDDQAEETYTYIYSELDRRNLAYVHVVERFPGYETSDEGEKLVRKLRDNFTGNYIGNGAYERDSASSAVDNGAFAVSFGRPFISNPDLPERLERGLELAEPDPETFYGGDERGYSDYPRSGN